MKLSLLGSLALLALAADVVARKPIDFLRRNQLARRHASLASPPLQIRAEKKLEFYTNATKGSPQFHSLGFPGPLADTNQSSMSTARRSPMSISTLASRMQA
jgi:hypothetical protein